MNKISRSILNEISEGIVVLNDNLEIYFWNYYMEIITLKTNQEVIGKSIYHILPNLNVVYFNKILQDILHTGNKMFFSAAMHKALTSFNPNFTLNLKLSIIEDNGSTYIFMEFIDVTNQFIQIRRLKDYVQELHQLNKALSDKEKEILDLAYYDHLTGLANRTLFFETSEQLLEEAKKNHSIFCLMFIDINKFKIINDTYGHEVGDKVINHVGQLLSEVITPQDIVARYGGDEFLILLPQVINDSYKNVVENIFSRCNDHLLINEQEITITLSIGISLYPKDGSTIDQMITVADHAMYAAKNIEGTSNYFCSVGNL